MRRTRERLGSDGRCGSDLTAEKRHCSIERKSRIVKRRFPSCCPSGFLFTPRLPLLCHLPTTRHLANLAPSNLQRLDCDLMPTLMLCPVARLEDIYGGES